MSLSGFIGYSCALAIAAIIPGPQIFAIIAQALRRGFGRAAWMTLGMVLGDVLYLTAVLVGLAFVAETLSFVLIAIKWAGVVYLPTIVNLHSITPMDGLALLAITGSILLVVQLPFAVAAARTRHLFRSPRRLRLINRSAAVCMGGAAAAVALRK